MGVKNFKTFFEFYTKMYRIKFWIQIQIDFGFHTRDPDSIYTLFLGEMSDYLSF